RQETAVGTESVVSVRNCRVDFLDADFESVSRLGAVHVDRPGQDVTARTLVRDFFVDVAQALLYLIGRKTGLLQSRRAISDQGVQYDGVRGPNMQEGCGAGAVVALGPGLRRGRQRVLFPPIARARRLGYILGRNGDHEPTCDKDRTTHQFPPRRKMLP